MDTLETIHAARPRHISSEEWAVRVDLAACYRLIAHFKWDDLVLTHNSARVPGTTDQMLINPSGLMFDEVTASNLLKVDINDGHLIGALGITEMALALAGIPHRKGGVQAAIDYIVSAHASEKRAAAE